MKKLIIASAVFLAASGVASAADLYVKAPTSAAYNWTGFYAGANIGYGFTDPHVPYSGNDFTAAGFFSPPSSPIKPR